MLSKAPFVNAGILLLLWFLVPTSSAQSNFPDEQNRSWDISVWMAGATGEEHTNSFTEAQILSGGVFVGKALTGEVGHGWRRGTWEFGMTLVPVFVQRTPERRYGGGFEPAVLRWNSDVHRGRMAPFLEMAGGGVHTNANLPAGSTSKFNFSARIGGGLQIFTRERRAVDVGCRWYHISNANLGLQNPEFNGIQVSLGYHWFK